MKTAGVELLCQKALCFDDVLLLPQYSEITSRSQIDVSTWVGQTKLHIPIISANMDTVTDLIMWLAMREIGAFGYVHRFMSREHRINTAAHHSHPPMSIGVGQGEVEIAKEMKDVGNKHLLVDVAHGHSREVIRTIEILREYAPLDDICAGNVVTAQAARDLYNAGANIIKVGVGPGKVCKTRVVTGHGYPQLSAVANVAREKEYCKFHLIADGGIRNSGDIVKAFAAGADAVMLGSLLVGCSESCSPTILGTNKKEYRGMASEEAQKARSSEYRVRAPEGISMIIDRTGSVKEVVGQLVEWIQSGCSYSGANNLRELYDTAEWLEVTGNSLIENNPRL